MYEGFNSGTPNEYTAKLGLAPTTIDVVNSPNTASFGFHAGIVAATGGNTLLKLGIFQGPGFGSIDDVSLIEVDDGAGNNLGAASQTVAAQASREFMDQLFDRFGHSGSPMQLASAGEVVVASNDGMTYINGPGHYRAFLSVYGDDARWDSGDVRAHRFGFMLGAEWAPCNNWDIGLAIGRTTSHFNTDTLFTDNSGRADETLGALYTNWSPNNGPFYATGIIGYGRSENDFMRENFFGAVGAYNVPTKQWFGGVEAGFDWRGWSRMTLTPFARVDAARLQQNSYMEEVEFGVLVPAFVDSKDQTAARSLLGLRATTDFNLIGRYPWQLSAKAAWQHEFDRNRSVTFSETSGVTFFGTATGATPVANSALVGASLEAPLTDHASFYAGYNGDFGSGQRIHEGEVGFKVTW
jgi:outer membrane autotransporter protein